MCELMGLSFAKPVSADFSIRQFAGRDEHNADGWGLAWYPDQSAALVKEPVSWRMSQYTGFLEKYQRLRSSIYIAHVRHKTVGGKPTHADTHPFQRELGGREYCFAHNGTLLSLPDRFQLQRFRPLGETDSEYAFCHLMDELAQRGTQLADDQQWRWLHGRLKDLNSSGKLNCLLSDGVRLFVYHDAAGYKGLTFRKIHIGSDQLRRFEDSQVQIDVEGESINQGYVVATHPLSESHWHPFQPGELMVLAGGAAVFSSHRRPHPADDAGS